MNAVSGTLGTVGIAVAVACMVFSILTTPVLSGTARVRAEPKASKMAVNKTKGVVGPEVWLVTLVNLICAVVVDQRPTNFPVAFPARVENRRHPARKGRL